MEQVKVARGALMYQNSESGVSVFRGVRTDTGEAVAVKEQVFRSLEAANQSIREAMAQIRLKHPNICQAIACHLEQRSDGIASILVLELMEKDLSLEIYERQQVSAYWSEDELLNNLSGLVSALKYAESVGVCHRDLKPSNIFVKDGYMKIGDFGSAGSNLDVQMMSKSLQGTPLFLSPELKKIMVDVMFMGKKDLQYDPFKSDVYSLGVTVLAMASLRIPEELCNLAQLEEKTREAVGALRSYPRLSPLLLSMLSTGPESRPSFSYLETYLSSLQRETMLSLQSLPAGMLDQTLKPCVVCGKPVLSMQWTAHIPGDCCRYFDYFADLCSLQCLNRMKSGLDERGVTRQCLWCLNPTSVQPSEVVNLPCGHSFHEKMCLFLFLKCMSENFSVAANFKCPMCGGDITKEFVDEVIGKTQMEESVYVYKSEVCAHCKRLQGERYCRNQHIFCGKCLQYYIYFIPMCPVCRSIRTYPIAKTDHEKEVLRILRRR